MRLIMALAALVLPAGCDQGPPPGPVVHVEDAMIMLPAVPGRPGVAYFTLRTNNDPTKIVRVTGAGIGRIELHETRNENGISKMQPIADLTFPQSGVMEFKAGGRHAMLFDLDPALKAGTKIPLTFTFEPAPPVTIQADVHAAGGHGGH